VVAGRHVRRCPLSAEQFYVEEALLGHLFGHCIHQQAPPQVFVDRFHKVRQMSEAFNDYYTKGYIPSWLNCLDELMNSWLNKYAPRFMNVPRKPIRTETNITQSRMVMMGSRSCGGLRSKRRRIARKTRRVSGPLHVDDAEPCPVHVKNGVV
jgi:hypothetical protein